MTHHINLRQLIDQALELRQQEHGTAETGKVGSYRAGNTGIKIGNRILGKCARKTYLRSNGVEHEHNDRLKFIMFAGGVMNEDVWVKDLAATWPGKILREEETPTSWKTPAGTLVTGRPDIVLCDSAGKPELGLELKMASSVWTARDVLFLELPKFDHMCQAAHYSWQLGVPFKLCYTSYVEYPIAGWMQRNFPKQGEKGSEFCEYNNKGDIKKMRPFIQIFDLQLDSVTGLLQYRLEGATGPWKPTVIGTEYIEAYFSAIDNVDKLGKLPSRPETVNVDGTKDGWSLCDYCPLKPVCDKHEGNLTQWNEAVRATANTGK